MKKISKTELAGVSSLFDGYSSDEIDEIIAPIGSFKEYDPGEVILFNGKDGNTVSLCIILSGKAVIRSCDTSKSTLLRFVPAGSAVGVAGLFSSSPIETVVTACGESSAAAFILSRDTVLGLIDKSEGIRFRNNLLNLLSDKVHFLNERISCVTGGSAERRLAVFLNSCGIKDEEPIDIGMSMTALAFSLDIGRASLYRAFDSLSSSGIIRREGDKLFITDRDRLEKII